MSVVIFIAVIKPSLLDPLPPPSPGSWGVAAQAVGGRGISTPLLPVGPIPHPASRPAIAVAPTLIPNARVHDVIDAGTFRQRMTTSQRREV